MFSLMDKNWITDLPDMQLISKYNKHIRLFVIGVIEIRMCYRYF